MSNKRLISFMAIFGMLLAFPIFSGRATSAALLQPFSPSNDQSSNGEYGDNFPTLDGTNAPEADEDLETMIVMAGGTPVTVSLVNTYVSPVVVCSVQYENNNLPAVARVSNVTSTSFDLRLQNPSGSAVASENISCVVVEEGTWTIDGVTIEAQTYLSTVTDNDSSWAGESQSYGQSYTNPVVIGQVMSENDPAWSVFWCSGSSADAPPSAADLHDPVRLLRP